MGKLKKKANTDDQWKDKKVIYLEILKDFESRAKTTLQKYNIQVPKALKAWNKTPSEELN